MSKVQIKILIENNYIPDKFEGLLKSFKKDGWKLISEHGGEMPNYKGHGAHLTKDI